MNEVKKKAKELIKMHEDMKPMLESITERINRQHKYWTIAYYTYWFLIIGFLLVMIYFGGKRDGFW